jgi:hypothetical protein
VINDGMKTYRLSKNGRTIAGGLALGGLVVWCFALWKLADVLGLNYLRLPSTLRGAVEQGLTASQIVPALMLLVLIVAAPLLIWNVIEEWSTTYTVRDDGLVYDTVQGISVLYPWSAIKGLRRVDPEADEPVHELLVDQAEIRQINSRVLRWLHRQAFGRSRIPIYAHVVDRAELIDAIVSRAGLQQGTEPRTKNQEPQGV